SPTRFRSVEIRVYSCTKCFGENTLMPSIKPSMEVVDGFWYCTCAVGWILYGHRMQKFLIIGRHFEFSRNRDLQPLQRRPSVLGCQRCCGVQNVVMKLINKRQNEGIF